MNRYIRLIVVACLALFTVSAWGDNFVFTGAVSNDWNDIRNWGNGQASPYYTGWSSASRLPQSGDCIYINATTTCPANLNCGDFYVNPNCIFTCNGNLTSTGHIHMYGGEIIVNGDIYCANEFDQQGSTSKLKCTGGFTSGNHVYFDGTVEIGEGGLDCMDINMRTNSSSFTCEGNVDTNGQQFVPKGNVDINGNLDCAYMPLTSNTSFKVGGDFRASYVGVEYNINGTTFVVDLLPDAINHSVDDTKNFINTLVAAGLAHKVDSYTWNGSKDSDWFNKENWKLNNDVPDASPNSVYADVSIPSSATNMPVISDRAAILVGNITINNDDDRCKLTLNEGACLDAIRIIVKNGNKVGAVAINQTSNKMVSLRLKSQVRSQTPDVDYTKTQIKTTYPTGRYMYVGSETTEGNIETNGAMFYLQDHATDSYVVATSYTNPFNQAGFIAKGGSGTFSVSQTGTIVASGSKTLEVRRWKSHRDGNNWCLLSNPFSFAYPLSSLKCDSKVDPVIWFDNYTGSGYQFTTYSVSTHVQVGNTEDSQGALSVGDVIAPQQAFFVRAADDAPENSVGFLTFYSVPTNYTLSSSSLKSSSIVNDVLRFTISSDESNTDEMAMVFRDGGSLDIIYGDAEKMSLEKTQNQVFAVKGSKRYAIPYYPSVEDASEIEFPIGIMLSSKSTQGKITATNIDMFDESVDVLLYDNLTGNVVNLREENTYQFNEIGGKYISDRFSVVLKYPEAKEEALGNSSLKKEEVSISVYSADGNIVVRSSIDDARIRVFDICGKVIAESKSAGSLTRIPVSCANGIYLVEVSSDDFTQTSKVLVNK
ncbi:MAG: T9SS type A sorting domain-containing protein [Bacteroidales bacterium]|nr:T9SS type A sorting domain-containing protein [Bacteroidales bacterium]